jgi:hypothetical protein
MPAKATSANTQMRVADHGATTPTARRRVGVSVEVFLRAAFMSWLVDGRRSSSSGDTRTLPPGGKGLTRRRAAPAGPPHLDAAASAGILPRGGKPPLGQPPSDIGSLLAAMAGGGGADPGMAAALEGAVSLRNAENLPRFRAVPYSRRLVFVPQCLRSTPDCRAEDRNHEHLCAECGLCKIATIVRRARELGYLGVRILKGGSALPRVLAEENPGAVLGVACCMEGFMGVAACERSGVPAVCVPLLKAGCSNTDVDLDAVLKAMEESEGGRPA